MRKFLLLGVMVLAAGCGPSSTDDWIRQLKDDDVVKRRQAIRELATRADQAGQVVPALITALGDESAFVRRDAAIALGKFGAEATDAVPTLTMALKDKDHGVRTAAGAALKKIHPQAAKKAGVS
jgi:HEAT repeat protein